MNPLTKDSEVVTKAVLRIVDRLGMNEPQERPVVYLRAPNELCIGRKHECEIIPLSKGQLRNLARDAVRLALDAQGNDAQMGEPSSD